MQDDQGTLSRSQTPDYFEISDYGIIGDLHTIALVNPIGGIDWCCLPYFDSASLFAKILDTQIGGSLRISPVLFSHTNQQYLGQTNILQTSFNGDDSEALLTDFMPILSEDGSKAKDNTVIVCRQIECLKGADVDFELSFDPQPDYARKGCGIVFEENVAYSNDPQMKLLFNVKMSWHDRKGFFRLSHGESARFIFIYGDSDLKMFNTSWFEDGLAKTKSYWETWIAKSLYRGRWQQMVERSALTLKLLIFKPTGAILAAPTSSLPEAIGCGRNWDYRFNWLRDSAWALNALFLLGYEDEAQAYMRWISQCLRHSDSVRVLYPIGDRDATVEATLDHLEGYQQSHPVRVGNAATLQLQLDVYGEVLESFFFYSVYAGTIDDNMGMHIERLADDICQYWSCPDEGIWEVRGPKRHFTYSKLMCWVGLDRAIRLVKEYGLTGDIEKWLTIKDEISTFISENCIHPSKHYLMESVDSYKIDASLLMASIVHFISPKDDIAFNTINEVIIQLEKNQNIYRYKCNDGLDGEEGSFNICTFWLVEALSLSGRVSEALRYFNHMIKIASPLGLYAEETDVYTNKARGNFPQAFTHIGFINAALTLNQILSDGNT